MRLDVEANWSASTGRNDDAIGLGKVRSSSSAEEVVELSIEEHSITLNKSCGPEFIETTIKGLRASEGKLIGDTDFRCQSSGQSET